VLLPLVMLGALVGIGTGKATGADAGTDAAVGALVGSGIGAPAGTASTTFAQQRTRKVEVTASQIGAMDNLVEPGAVQ